MDTSLAEEVQHAATTLESDRFLYVALPQLYHVRLLFPLQ